VPVPVALPVASAVATESGGKQMAEGHSSKATSWATVLVIIAGFILLGFALPMQSLILGIAGGVVLVAGLVMAFAFQIMEDFH
jgi:membrane-bound ClpP family serine protease